MRRLLLSGFLFFVRLALGCLFIYSGVVKVRQPYDFLSSVYEYELVGPKLGTLVAMTLPWLELLVGVCLIGGIFVGGALLACIGMGAMFTFAIASALYRDLGISCGCFGAAGLIDYSTLIRAVLVFLFSTAAYIAAAIIGSYPVAEKTDEYAYQVRGVKARLDTA